MLLFFTFIRTVITDGQYLLQTQTFDCPLTCNGCVVLNQCLNCKTIDRDMPNMCVCKAAKGSFSQDGTDTCLTCTDPYCLECFYPNWCTLCDSSLQMVVDLETLTCVCTQGYFQLNGSCQGNEIQTKIVCDQTCLVCNGLTKNDCTACGESSQRVLDGTQCNCLPGLYEDPESYICKQCGSTCLTCGFYYNTCTSCSEAQFRILSNDKCICAAGYYEQLNQDICQLCGNTCLTCSNSDTCLTCDPNNNRVFYNNSCICLTGYGRVAIGSAQCIPCHPSCQTCITGNQASECSTCFYPKVNVGGQCVVKCHYSCLTCSVSNDSQSCLTCPSNRYVNPLNQNECLCNSGSFDDARSCWPCHYSCLECFNGWAYNWCRTCPSTRTHTNLNTCVCTNPLQVDVQGMQQCQDCHYSCATCTSNTPMTCLTCDANHRNLWFGWCVCNVGTYDVGVFLCNLCHWNCRTCNGPNDNQCLTCYKVHQQLSPNSQCVCSDGYYWDDTIKDCLQCSYKCRTCVNPNSCTDCAALSYRTMPSCDCTDPVFKVSIVGVYNCQQCNLNCLDCDGTSLVTCSSCDSQDNRILNPQTSTCDCQTGYYDNGLGSCLNCSQFCETCVNFFDNCTTCSVLQYRILSGNSCICQDHYYESPDQDPVCLKCFDSCKTCSGGSSDQCLTCPSGVNRIQNGSSCNCIFGYYQTAQITCEQCQAPCQTCINLQACLSCQGNLNRIYDPITNTCPCSIFYFEVVGQLACSQCDYTCQSCYGNKYSCTVCYSNVNRVFDSISKSCNCEVGYFDSGSTYCTKCLYSCFTCTNLTECSSCPSTRQLIGQQCQCNQGFYDVPYMNDCQICSIQCQTCSGSSANCLTCPQTRLLQNNQCICAPGFVDVGSQTCQNCDSTCKTCIDQSTNCTSCDAQKFRVLSSQTCVCIAGYYEYNMLCYKCSSICQTCKYKYNHCRSCDSSLFRYLTPNNCECMSGFYDDGTLQCKICDQKCLTCENQSNNCLSCDSINFRLLNQNQCLCIDGYYDNGFQTVCQICNPNCLTCSGQSNFCLTCDSSKKLVLSENKCICFDGYFQNSNGICQICDKTCLLCTNSSTFCTQCVQIRNLVLNQCFCIDGYFENSSRDCIQCGVTCLTCLQSANNCQTCSDLSFRIKQGSQCNCKDGYVEAGVQICKPCSYQCKTCQLQAEICTSCSSAQNVNRILKNNTCICNKGFYDNGTLQCQPCGYSCQECTNAVYCTVCNTQSTFRLDQSKTGTCPCQSGFYDSGSDVCSVCSYQCSTCSQVNKCITCKIVPNSNRINQPFTCPCQPGYFDDGQQITCQQCNPICATCQSQSSNCLTCKGQFVSSAPDCFCIQSYFRDLKLVCSPCDWQCLTCINNKSNCQQCRGNRISKTCVCEQSFYEANQELCLPCAHKCLTCITKSTQCIQCKGDRINSPQCICKDGFYDDGVNINCAKCDYTCATCNLAGCLTCAGNRVLQDTFCNPPDGSVSYESTPWCSTCTVAVLNITFASSLDYVNIKFDFPVSFTTKQTTSHDLCSTILTQATIQKLGQSPSCYSDINNQDIIILKLGQQATITQNDSISLLVNSLIVYSCRQQLNLFVNNIVQFPEQIYPPQLQIQAPSGKISPCQSVNINSGLQLYDGMRSLSNFYWTAFVPTNPQADISQLRTLLNRINKQQITSLEIPPFIIPENSYVQINITYMSFANIYNTTTINLFIGTRNTPLIYFSPEQMQVYSWQKVQLIINYANQKCDGDNNVKANTSLNINIYESSRHPQSSKPLKNYSQMLGTPDQSQLQIYIDSFTLSPNAIYYLNVTGYDVEDTLSVSFSVLQITVNPSTLLAQIVGGSRIQNYNTNYDVEAQFKDPDDFYDFNKDPYISFQMTCIDIQTNNNCQYANKTYIKLNESSIQHIIGGSFDSFTVQQWEIRVQKGLRFTSSISLIILVDYQFPQITIDYPSGYQARQISLNEDLFFTIKSDEDNTLFSFALIYNYKQVAVSNMLSNQIKFKMWDYFEDFLNGDKITLKFQAQGLKTILPGIADCILQVKQPPVGAQFKVYPTNGTSFQTVFSITILQAYDTSLPLQYRFILFDSVEDYLTFNMSNSILLCDFQKAGYINSILFTNQNQVIAGQVKNAQGSTRNLTLQLNISSSNYTCDNFTFDLSKLDYLLIILQLKELMKQNITCIDSVWQIQQQVLKIVNIEVDSHQQYLCQKILQLTSDYLIINKQQFQNKTRLIQQYSFDKDQIQEQLKQIQIHSNQLITKGFQYAQTITDSIDFGDPITQNLEYINFYQRFNIYNQIDLLQILIYTYNLTYDNILDDFQLMTQIIKNVSESLLMNQLLNQNRIRFIGNQIRTNIAKVDKKNFNKLISYSPENLVENDGLDDAMKGIIIQFLVYKFKYNFYSFNKSFNKTIQVNPNTTKNDIIQYEIPTLLNQTLYLMNLYYMFAGNNNTISYINYGYLTYYMGRLDHIYNYTQYHLRCYQLWDDMWLQDKCNMILSNDNNQTNIFCQCQYTNPVTLMGIEIKYDKQANITIVRSFLSQQQDISDLYLFWVLLAQLILVIPFIFYILKLLRQQKLESKTHIHSLDSPKNEIQYTFEQFGSSLHIVTNQTSKHGVMNDIKTLNEIPLPEITKQVTSIDFPFIKQWFWTVYEITAIFKGHDKQVQPYQKLILLEVNIAFTFELTILFFYIFPYTSIIPFILTLTIIINFLTKILQSLLTTLVFKHLAYILLGLIWSGQFLVLKFPGTYIPKDYNGDLFLVYIISIILQYSIIETIIVIVKMKGLFAIKKMIKEDPMNPILHVAYFVFFNDTLDQEFNEIIK